MRIDYGPPRSLWKKPHDAGLLTSIFRENPPVVKESRGAPAHLDIIADEKHAIFRRKSDGFNESPVETYTCRLSADASLPSVLRFINRPSAGRAWPEDAEDPRRVMGRSSKRISVLMSVATILAACASLAPERGIAPSRPTARDYLAHGMGEVEAADSLRRQRSPMPIMGGVFNWPPDHEKWMQHLRQAEADFRTILDRFPESPEAAEAQFMLGTINDHPYRNRFDDAVREYRHTIAGFPGTSAAERALRRIAVIEAIRR